MGKGTQFLLKTRSISSRDIFRWGFIILFLFPIEFLSAQPFEVTSFRYQPLGIEQVIYDLDEEECGHPENIGSIPFHILGMATCPNGQVFVRVSGTPEDLYLLDTNSGDFTFYSSPPPSLPPVGGHISGLLCPEPDVFIYIMDDSYYYKVDLNLDTAEAMDPTGFGDNPIDTYNATSGMTLMNGKGYRPYNDVVIPPANLGIVEFDPLDPSNSSLVVETGGYPDRIWALAPTPHCNILIGSAGPLFGVGQDMSAWVFNVATGDFYKLCDNDWDRNIRYMTTPYEHEEQECNLIINLDYLDETDAPEYDYLNPEPYTCLSEGAAIAHEVVFIAAYAPIDYMTVELIEPLPDSTQEYLKVGGIVPGITVTGDETHSLLLTNDGSANTQSFLDIIQLINYHNDATYPTEGRRNIEVQFVDVNIEASNVATGMVDVEELEIIAVDLGEDVWICEGETQLLTSGLPSLEHLWSTGEETPEIAVAETGLYSLTVSDGVRCPGSDSLQLDVRPLVELEVEVDNDLCLGHELLIVIHSGSNFEIDFEIVTSAGEVIEFVEGMIQFHLFFISDLQESLSLGIQQVHSEEDICIEFSEELHEIEILPVYEVTDTAQICSGDSIWYAGEWIQNPGYHEFVLETQMGCDSTLQLYLEVLPADSSIHWVYSCDPQAVDTSIVLYQNQFGCDSVVIQITDYYAPDSTFFTSFSCDPEEEQLVVDTFTNLLGCDSLVFTGVQYLPSDTTSLVLYTCDPDEEGSFTDSLTNSHGCDSLVFVQVHYVPSDTLLSIEYSCVESEAEYVEEQYTNRWGCDSLVISVVEYITPDFTFIQLSSCNPEDEGIFVDSLVNSFGCDSLVITTVVFALADSTFLSEVTCDEQQAGWVVDSLVNSQGCDSLVFTEFVFLPVDSVLIYDITCDPDQESPVIEILSNQYDCDSIVVTFFDFIPSDTTLLFDSSCDPDEVGIFEMILENQFGCDSLVISQVELLPSYDILLTEESCNPGDTGTFVQQLVNSFGCDSIITTAVELLPSDTTFFEFYTCDPAEVDSTVILLENRFGCDSLVISLTRLAESPQLSLNPLVLYAGFGVSCKGEEDGALEAEVEGGIPSYSIFWGDGSELWARSGLVEGIYSATVTDHNGCSDDAEFALLAPDSLMVSLVITHPDCFDEQTGGIQVLASGGVPPYRFSLNSDDFSEENTFVGLQPGLYEIAVLDANMCLRTEAVLIQSPELLEVSLGEDREVAVGDSVLLEIITNVPYDSLVSIAWKGLQNPDCEDCPLVWDQPLVSTTYSVTITDRDGCMASDQMTVSVDAARDIFVPNAFSPNGDGVNDYFTVFANERNVKQVLSLKVFNRFGEQVFHRTHFPPNEPTEGWDGTFRDQPLNPGVFVWMVEVEFAGGEVVVLSGEVLVVR